jgi:hypothetical protein
MMEMPGLRQTRGSRVRTNDQPGASYVAPPDNAILTKQQVAEWLQVSTDMVDRLDLRHIPMGERKVRYLAKQVLEDLERRTQG